MARHRNRAALLLRYLDLVARPRIEAGRPPLPDDDALSLDALALG